MRTVCLLVGMFGLVVGRPAAAQDFGATPGGTTGTALAGACTTSVNDPTTLWANPGSLGHTSQNISVSMQLRHTGRSTNLWGTEAGSATAPESRDTAGVAVSAQVGLALPIHGKNLWLGFGYHAPYTVRSSFAPQQLNPPADRKDPLRRDEPGRYLGSELELDQHMFSVGLALRWRFLGLGAAVELSHVRLSHVRSLWGGAAGDRRSFGHQVGLDLEAAFEAQNMVAGGGRFGVRLEPTPWLRIGLVVSLPLPLHLTGDLTVTPGHGTPAGYASWSTEPGPVALDWELPLELRAGVSLAWGPLRAHGEFSYQRWSASDAPTATADSTTLMLTPTGSSTPQKVALDELPLGLALRDRFGAHLGLEATLFEGLLVARIGYAYIRGASDPQRPSPVLLDLNRHLIGIGGQLNRGRLFAALSLSHAVRAEVQPDSGETRVVKPLDAKLTDDSGAGRYAIQSTEARLQFGFFWH